MEKVTISEIRSRYAFLNPEGHWFDKDTMRFFHTQLPAYGTRAPDGSIWFTTAETDPSGEKRWSVRCLTPGGFIHTVDGFHKYRTNRDAGTALRAAIIHSTEATQ